MGAEFWAGVFGLEVKLLKLKPTSLYFKK